MSEKTDTHPRMDPRWENVEAYVESVETYPGFMTSRYVMALNLDRRVFLVRSPAWSYFLESVRHRDLLDQMVLWIDEKLNEMGIEWKTN